MREVPLPAPTGRISKMMKDNAKKALREWRNELIGSPKRMSSDSTTIAKYVKHYISVLEANKIVEASTLGCYREMLKTIERYDIGSIKLNDLSAEDAETWISQLLADNRARSSIRKSFNVLHAAVKHAVSSKRLHADPLGCIKTPKLENK